MNITKKWFDGNIPVNAVPASIDSDFSVNHAEIVITAKTIGKVGNDITVNLIAKEESKIPLSVEVDGKNINVVLATNDSEEVITKASELISAIKAHPEANNLIDIKLATGSNGSGVVVEDELKLKNGVDGTVCQDTEVIVEYSGQKYINIAPNSIRDANWRKLNIVEY